MIANLMNTLTEMEDVLHAIKQKEKFTTIHQNLANVTSGQEDNKMEIVDQIVVPNTNVSLKEEAQLNRRHNKVNAFHAVQEKNQAVIVEHAI
jgi:glycerol-3-phosphate responsive antiterminator